MPDPAERGTRDLDHVLAHLDPRVRSGAFVMATLPTRSPVAVEATIVEDEGITHVVDRAVAEREGWDHGAVLAWITLGAVTDLELVGLTAAVATALAGENIACNVLAGHHHDHLLVPMSRLDDALLVLSRMG